MDSTASPSTATSRVNRSESLRKRPHEQSNSSSGEMSLPTKFKPSGTSDLVAMDSCTAEFVMEQRVQDVEEHFRRSLLSLQQQKQQQQVTQSAPTTGSLPLATSSVTSNGVLPLRSIRKTQEDHEPHQILITENSSTSSSPTSLTMHPVGGVGVGGASQTVLTSQNNVQFIVTSTPSNNVMTTAPLATNGPTLISALPGGTAFNQPIFLNIPSTTNNDKSEGAAAQVITSPGIAQKTGPTSVMLPTFQGVIPTLAPPQLIPLVDNGGTLPQIIPTVTSNTPHTPISGASPVFYVGPNGLPMLAQSGLVFMNPTDMTRSTITLPQSHIPAATTSSTLPASSHQSPAVPPPSLPPNYIIIPSPFTNPVNYSLASLEQMAQLQVQQQQQQQQQPSLKKDSGSSKTHHRIKQKVNIDLTSTATSSASEDRICVGGSLSSMEDLSDANKEVMSSGIHGSIDSVEEHFARALGDQWTQVKKASIGGNPSGNGTQSKITV